MESCPPPLAMLSECCTAGLLSQDLTTDDKDCDDIIDYFNKRTEIA